MRRRLCLIGTDGIVDGVGDEEGEHGKEEEALDKEEDIAEGDRGTFGTVGKCTV